MSNNGKARTMETLDVVGSLESLETEVRNLFPKIIDQKKNKASPAA
ncbi:MAG: hypothetical protein ACJARR_004134 [Pseudophaeobacter arcticus]|jgi:hypothetical protein